MPQARGLAAAPVPKTTKAVELSNSTVGLFKPPPFAAVWQASPFRLYRQTKWGLGKNWHTGPFWI